MSDPIPVILFAHARVAHLSRVLSCIRENNVPLLYAFADGPRHEQESGAVAQVREMLRRIDWCEVRLVERPANLGLGRSVLAGVSEVAARHEAFIVWEDDLIAVPGTYQWLRNALRHYATCPRVMSVTAWTHPRVTPPDVAKRPYLDARAECWVWGTWARSWRGMDVETALEKAAVAAARGIAPDAYGADLPEMAAVEREKNIWAVRWLYHHLQHGGLCLRPPWSMVEHIGFDASATNAEIATAWANPPLRGAPPVPERWPDVEEHPACAQLWRNAAPPARDSWLRRVARKMRTRWRRVVK